MAELHTTRGRATAPAREEGGRARESMLELARAAAAGDEEAVGALYERRFAMVFDAARAATGRDEQFCLDVVQECFLRVLRAGPALGKLHDAAHVDRWLVRVAQTSALDLLRAERRRSQRERLVATPEQAGRLDNQIASLDVELSRLSAEERELVRLRASGLTLNGIAELIGTTVGTVHGRLRRLSAAFRATKKEPEYE